MDLFEQVFSDPDTKPNYQAEVSHNDKVTPIAGPGSTVASEVFDASPNPFKAHIPEGELSNQVEGNQGHYDARLFA